MPGPGRACNGCPLPDRGLEGITLREAVLDKVDGLCADLQQHRVVTQQRNMCIRGAFTDGVSVDLPVGYRRRSRSFSARGQGQR